MNLKEVEKGFKLFQKQYLFKRCIIYTAVYLLIIILAVDLIIKNPSSMYGYIALALGVALVIRVWYNPIRVRKKLINTMSSMYEEKYVTQIYGDRIEITTEIFKPVVIEAENNEIDNKDEISKDKDTVDGNALSTTGEEDKNADDKTETETEKSIWYFGSDFMEAIEAEDMFLLFVRRSLIYVYPKRCLSEEEQNSFRNIIEAKAL